MERFSYQSLAAAKAESTELLYLLECASFGRQQDELEKLEQKEMEWEQQRLEMEKAHE